MSLLMLECFQWDKILHWLFNNPNRVIYLPECLRQDLQGFKTWEIRGEIISETAFPWNFHAFDYFRSYYIFPDEAGKKMVRGMEKKEEKEKSVTFCH